MTCACWADLLTYAGALLVATVLFRVGALLVRHLRPGPGLARYGANKGAWAVVTGASDGIGAAYAQALGEAGFNLVLLSRTEAKLKAVAETINEDVDVEWLAVDFSAAGDSDYARIGELLKGKRTTVLVNNVGISYDGPLEFLEVPAETINRLVTVNIDAQNRVTRLVLPMMVEQKAGLVVNLSSLSAVAPVPLLTVYSASKAYVNFWSQGLAREYASYGVHVECHTPGFVATKMAKMRPSLTVPTPEAYAKRAVSKMGRYESWAPFFWHDLMRLVVESLPVSVAMGMQHMQLAGLRKRYLKKLEAKKKQK